MATKLPTKNYIINGQKHRTFWVIKSYKMRGSRKQFNLVQDSQAGHKTHCRITHKYAYTTLNVGCRKCYWIWIGNGINFFYL